jgi:hypothetical protein
LGITEHTPSSSSTTTTTAAASEKKSGDEEFIDNRYFEECESINQSIIIGVREECIEMYTTG